MFEWQLYNIRTCELGHLFSNGKRILRIGITCKIPPLTLKPSDCVTDEASS